MKKGSLGPLRGASRLKIDVPLAIYWKDTEDLESKIDYNELVDDEGVEETIKEDIHIPVFEKLKPEGKPIQPYKRPTSYIKFGGKPTT